MHNIILKMTHDKYYNKLCYIETNVESKNTITYCICRTKVSLLPSLLDFCCCHSDVSQTSFIPIQYTLMHTQ